MEQIIKKYKERLINLSGRNRSLVMKKIVKKRAFDLVKLENLEENIGTDLLEFIINRKESSMIIIKDPYQWFHEQQKEMEKRLKEEENNEKKKIDESNVERTAVEVKVLKEEVTEKFLRKRDVENKKLDRELERRIDYSKGLDYLRREIEATEKETGRMELFIGYPFVEGYFQDKTFTKAPVCLFPVTIVKQGDNWLLKNRVDEEVMLNKVFLLAYSKYNEKKLKELVTEYDSLIELGKNPIQKILSDLVDAGIALSISEDFKVYEGFKDTVKGDEEQYRRGELGIKSYLVLGQFPIANSIYNDYLELESMEIQHAPFGELIQGTANGSSEKKEEPEEHGKLSFSEKDLFLITSLDYSQEKAVQKVNSTDQLVIYGPPGTGKSQTIASIISDNLAKGQRILMVSQKRAALDVIYNRLGPLNKKAILLHDAQKDKKEFYLRVAKEIEDLQTSHQQDMAPVIIEKGIQIDKNTLALEEVAQALHIERSTGLSLQQMYAKTKEISDRNDVRYPYFKRFRENILPLDLSYKQLLELTQRLLQENIIENYKQGRDILEEYVHLSKLKASLTFIEVEELDYILSKLMKDYEALYKVKQDSEEYHSVVKLYKDKAANAEETDILALAKALNQGKNGDLLVPINSGKWWSLSYWVQYNQNKQKELENRNKYEQLEIEIRSKLQEHLAQLDEYFAKLKKIETYVTKSTYVNWIEDILNESDVTTVFSEIRNQLIQYETYDQLMSPSLTLSTEELQLLEYAYETSKTLEMRTFVELLPELMLLEHIYRIDKPEVEGKVLANIPKYSIITQEINSLLREKQAMIPKHIIRMWSEKIVDRDSKTFREFTRQANKKRQLWPIRKYLAEFSSQILDLYPIWLMGPETVSEVLPLQKDLFDVVIFDEASQMFIENALPTVFRGQKIVIAGDDKQLRPSSTFSARMDNDEEEVESENAAALEEESLLDLAKVNYDSAHLNYHYRSEKDELINFSNYAFYQGRLQVAPNLSQSRGSSTAMHRVKVEGQWIDRKNMSEALQVVDVVDTILRTRKRKETIGIITFNVNQKDLIEDLLDQRAQKDHHFRNLYVEEINRNENNEDVSLFVKNIENVQGDERDIIIFSIGYAPNEKGKISVNFGSLSQEGGENRLNVAISRAKKKIIVVTSIEPEELQVDDTKNNGPKLFKKYLQYVKFVSEGDVDSAQTLLYSLSDSNTQRNTVVQHDSDFEMEVYDRLIDLGYVVDTQVGVSGYKIDMAVYDCKQEKYILGIECDGAAYHSSKSARERDIHRQRYLESRGWKIARIWSKDWWKNPDAEIQKIQQILGKKEVKVCEN